MGERASGKVDVGRMEGRGVETVPSGARWH